MARPAENKLTLFGVFIENLCDYLGLDFENNGNKVAMAITGATSSGRASHYLRPEKEKERQSDVLESTGYDLNYGFHTATIARMIASSYGNVSYSSRQAIRYREYSYGKIPLLKTGRDDVVTAQALGEAVDAWWSIDESDECNTRSRILEKGITVKSEFFVNTCNAYIRRYASEEAERIQIEDDLWNYIDGQLGTLGSVGGEKMTKTLYRSLLVPILLGPDAIPSMGLLYNVTPRKAAEGDGIERRFELGGQTSLAADGFFLEQVVEEEGTTSVANHVDYDKGAAVLLGMEGDDSEVCYFPLPPAGTCCISRSHAWIIPQKDNGGKLRWVLEDCSKNGTVVCGSDGIPKKLSKGEAQCLSDGDEIWLVPGIDRRGNPVPDINRGEIGRAHV